MLPVAAACREEKAAEIREFLQDFWEGLGVPAFQENTVTKGQRMPYVTYSYALPKLLERVQVSASLLTYSADFVELEKLTEIIMQKIPEQGALFYAKGRAVG